MQAILNTAYGPPAGLNFSEIALPEVDDDGVLVRVQAASVNAFDWHVMRGLPYVVRSQEGLRAPKQPRLGVDVAGVVEAVGRNVTQLRPGDEVFGTRRGAFAEYVCGVEKNFAPKPSNLNFEQAAATPLAATTALQALRDKGQVQAGQRVLINGATGGVGSFAVQLGKAFGAEVTGVCSTRNLELVRSLGAAHVIDYTRDDVTTGGQHYDLVVDVAGNLPLSAARRILAPRGTYVLVGAPPGQWVGPLARPLAAVVRSRFGSQRLLPLLATLNRADLLTLTELSEAGTITPVIDRSYALRETAAAMHHLESGHPQGKIVITV